MNDPLRARYEAVPYRHGAVPHSHPARVGAIARLLGLRAAGPDGCRVLELGCAEGMNLLPLAERLPKAEFTGVDLSARQIAVAEAARAACGLSNAKFIHADLREWTPESGGYDYVIAHGIYSWVPAEVRERLLAVCAQALAPGGVAYVSYNVLPGWGLLSGLRRFLLGVGTGAGSPEEELARVEKVLEAMGSCVAEAPGAYAALLREAVADMRRKPAELLFHDELGLVNEPVTFREFTAAAQDHGLHFLAEAHYASMPVEHVPAAMRERLAGLELDFLGQQQMMDVLFQRWVRASLLCRERPGRTVEPAVMRECAIGLRLRPESGRMDLRPGVKVRMLGPNGVTLEVELPEVKAALAVLAQAGTHRVAFPAMVEAANRFLNQVGLPPMSDDAALCAELVRLFSVDAIDVLLAGDGNWLKTAEKAAPSALMRYQAREDLPLANRWHELIELTAEGRAVLADAGKDPGAAVLQQAGLLV